MLFNSLTFALLFLPVAFAGYHLCCRLGSAPARAWMVFMSLVFYFWWNPPYVLLLLGSIAANYAFGALIQRSEPKPRLQSAALALGVAFNLLLLCYYKYFFPLLHFLEGIGLHFVSHPGSVILPLGISFFTFTQIGYLVDCRGGVARGHKPLDYSLFVTFFPHLIAGPILHHKEMIPQFGDPATYRFNAANVRLGVSVFLLGLAKKTLIADNLAQAANKAFLRPENLSLLGSWHGALAYSLQLYFDFSGYSEMALGLALLFNLRLPPNFDSPYKSTSIIEFWQRWHITLTRYINLYIYNPIALRVTRTRMAEGKPLARAGLRTVSGFCSMVLYPTFVALFLAGVWHGAGLQFIIFGLLHAVYLTVNHLFRILRHKHGKVEPDTAWHVIAGKVLLTYLSVLVAQIFFRASSVENAIALLKGMIGLNPNPPMAGWREMFALDHGFAPVHMAGSIYEGSMWAVLILFCIVWGAPNILQIFSNEQPALVGPKTPWESALRWRPSLAWGVVLGLVGGIAFLAMGEPTVFLYFQF